MSGQYPGGYNNPLGGGHRGQFNPQQQQMVGGNIMPMGNYPQSGMLAQQQNQMQSNVPNMGPGGVGMMNPAAIQTPSHLQQQQMMQQQPQQFQMQQQMASHMGGAGGSGTSIINPGGGNMIQVQQQQQQHSQQMNPNVSTSHAQLQGTGPTTSHHTPQQPAHTNSMLAIAQPNPHKEINIVMLSRLGQETVQDITSRFQEIFAALKIIQPMANRDNNTEKKVQEYFRTIRLLFKRVRIIYEKCNDGYPQGMEYTNVESLVPYKDEPDHRIEPTQCEEYRKALQENQELIETVKLKNRQLREIIDRTRIIIWEINTMLSMRRS